MDGPGARPANSMTLRPVRGGGPIGEDDAMVMFFSFRVSALEWDRMLKRGGAVSFRCRGVSVFCFNSLILVT